MFKQKSTGSNLPSPANRTSSSALCALPNKCSRLRGSKSIFTVIRGMLNLGLWEWIIPIAKSAPSSRSCKGNPHKTYLSSANHKTEKEVYDMLMDLEVQGTMSAGFQCTKCATAQGDQNPEHRTFKYDDMRKHVFEHGRGDHDICEACSFFEYAWTASYLENSRAHFEYQPRTRTATVRTMARASHSSRKRRDRIRLQVCCGRLFR